MSSELLTSLHTRAKQDCAQSLHSFSKSSRGTGLFASMCATDSQSSHDFMQAFMYTSVSWRIMLFSFFGDVCYLVHEFVHFHICVGAIGIYECALNSIISFNNVED